VSLVDTELTAHSMLVSCGLLSSALAGKRAVRLELWQPTVSAAGAGSRQCATRADSTSNKTCLAWLAPHTLHPRTRVRFSHTHQPFLHPPTIFAHPPTNQPHPHSAFEPAALKEFIRNLRYEPVTPVTGACLCDCNCCKD
jgi:hypothetical protein